MNVQTRVLLLFFALILKSLKCQELSKPNNDFTIKLHKEIAKNEALDNFIVSPFSAQTILALTTLGTKHDTYNELKTTLELPGEFKEIFAKFLQENFQNGKRLSTLSSSNKIYLEQGFGVVPSFLNDATTFFRAGVENVNFNNAENTTRKINSWVNTETNGKISEIITENDINELTRVVLINTLYFKAQWAYPFYVKNTKKMDFHNVKNVAQVDTMKSLIYVQHCRNHQSKFQTVHLPYRAVPVEMVLVLPDEMNGINTLDIETVLKGENNCSNANVQLSLPKFKVETATNLVPILQNLGVKKLFNQDADLSGLSIREGLYVSKVLQKVFMGVDEIGTEAAAATAVISNAKTITIRRKKEPIEMKFDHPFLFYLKLKDVVLFSGSISKLE